VANGNITVTTAANAIPEEWASEALMELQAKLGLRNRISSRFEDGHKVGDTVNIYNVTNPTANNKTANTALTPETFTEAQTNITIDVHKAVAFRIEKIVDIFSNLDLRSLYIKGGTYSLLKAVDVEIGSLFQSFTQTVGTLAFGLTDDERLQAIQKIVDANVVVDNPDDLTFALSGKEFLTNWLPNERISNMQYGGGNSVLKDGRLGQVYGATVFMSTTIEGDNTNGHDNALFHREALGIIMQETPTWDSWRNPLHLADEVVADSIWGVDELRDVAGVWLPSL